MGLEGVVLCSEGVRVAQRGTELPLDTSALRVRNVATVSLPSSRPMEARRSDGVVWRRHWLDHDRLVIEFVGITNVEVHDHNGDVIFDRPLSDDMEQHLLFDHVLPLVLARRGHLVLHGGVISRSGKGVLLVGSSGAGKSTLTAFAWRQGWTVGGDDGAVLSMTDPPMIEPTYATMRLTPASVLLLGIAGDGHSTVVGKLRVGGQGERAFRQERVRLCLIAIIAAAPEGAAATFDPLDALDAHAKLFGSTFHTELKSDRFLPAIVDRLASIVETTTVGSLKVPRGIDGLVAAETLLRTQLSAVS